MRNKVTFLLMLLALCLLAVSVIRAAPTAYELSWWTVDGGGGTSSGGAYILNGTIGQHDAHCASGGTYLITAGFWHDAVIFCNRILLPVLVK
jgi:hypothetical protein